MSTLSKICFCFVLILALARPVLADDGCVDSPENPTVVLAIVGSAGALFSTLRYKARARRNSSR